MANPAVTGAINAMNNPDFATILEPFGEGAEAFFLAASLYHAGKVSFGAAAALSGLGYEEFHYRLKEHFGHGFRIEDAIARDDLRLGAELAGLS
jgi:predicted HTH domain antitoxin